MAKALEVAAFWEEMVGQQVPLVDVRSPGEFQKGHIPGAVNIPLFDNNERAIVGTLYKQQGREAAFLKGLELVGPKLRAFVEQAHAMNARQQLLTHCWRGGMRSNSMATLWEAAGLQVKTLTGGYKAYRRWVQEELKTPYNLMVIAGRTGSGKTEMLHALAQMGEQIIDLEGLAHHKGSAFGSIGEEDQPSTEHFENVLHQHLSQLDPARRIWVEDESMLIGKVFIPTCFFEQMAQSPTVVVHVPIPIRVDYLVRVYAQADHQEGIEAINRIEKRLGGQHAQAAICAIQRCDYAAAAEICLKYYDKAYDYGLKQKPSQHVSNIRLTEADPVAAAHKLLQHAQGLIPHT